MPAKSHSKQNAQAEMVYCQGPSPILSFGLCITVMLSLVRVEIDFGARPA
jgi:hypothetical protein